MTQIDPGSISEPAFSGLACRLRMALCALSLSLIAGSAVAERSVADAADRVIADLKKVLDAHSRYREDTGEVLPVTSDTRPVFGYLKIDNLVEDPGLKNWQGPYLPYKTDWRGRSQYLSHSQYSGIQLQAKQTGEWARGSMANGCKQSSPSCTIAACIWRVPIRLAQEINHRIDGVRSTGNIDLTGNIRYESGTILFTHGIVCLKGEAYPPSASPNP